MYLSTKNVAVDLIDDGLDVILFHDQLLRDDPPKGRPTKT